MTVVIPTPPYPPKPIVGQVFSAPLGAASQWDGVLWLRVMVPGYGPPLPTDDGRG